VIVDVKDPALDFLYQRVKDGGVGWWDQWWHIEGSSASPVGPVGSAILDKLEAMGRIRKTDSPASNAAPQLRLVVTIPYRQWVKITCTERDELHAARSGPGFGRLRQWSTPDMDTHPDGADKDLDGEELGPGVRVISEYGLFITQEATLQDHRYPPVTKHHSDRRPCEHYELRII
jgi:hypothetical protein